MRKSHRTFSSRQREFKRTSKIVEDNVDSNVESLSRKQRGLRRLEYERDQQSEEMTERERKLSAYAKTLVATGESIKSKTRKWKRKKEDFAKTFAEEQQRLTKQLHSTELKEEPIEQRLLSLNRERLKIEGRVDTLNRQTLSLSELYDTYQSRVEELLRRDKQSEIFEIHRQIRETRDKIGRTGERRQQIEARMRGYVKALEDIHHVANSVSVQACVFTVELQEAREARDRDLHQARYQVELAATKLAEARRRVARKKEKQKIARGRIGEMEKRVARLSELEAELFMRCERAKTGRMIAQSQIDDAEHAAAKTRRKIDGVVSGMAEARDNGIDATMKLIQLRQELSKVVKERRKVDVEIDQAKQELDAKRRQLNEDELNAIAFMRISQELERQAELQAELENELSEARQKPAMAEKIDTSKEEQAARASAEKIEREVELERDDMERLSQRIAEVEEAMRAQMQKRQAIEDETNEVWRAVSESGDARSAKAVEAQIQGEKATREQKLQTMKDDVQKLVDRQEQLRQNLVKRKALLEEKHHKFQMETGGFTAEEHIGFLSLQDFNQLLSEELTKWRGELAATRAMLNSWGSKIDGLFEQLDSFYLTWI